MVDSNLLNNDFGFKFEMSNWLKLRIFSLLFLMNVSTRANDSSFIIEG